MGACLKGFEKCAIDVFKMESRGVGCTSGFFWLTTIVFCCPIGSSFIVEELVSIGVAMNGVLVRKYCTGYSAKGSIGLGEVNRGDYYYFLLW